MKIITLHLSMDEAKKVFDALENLRDCDLPLTELAENLGYRIEAADEVEINGIHLKPSRPSDADDTEF